MKEFQKGQKQLTRQKKLTNDTRYESLVFFYLVKFNISDEKLS